MQLNIEGDTRAVLRDLGFRVPQLSERAQVTAMNRTIAKVATQFRRGVSKETGIKQKVLRKRYRVYRARFRRSSRARVWLGTAVRIPVSEVLTGKGRIPKKFERYIDYPLGQGKAFQQTIRGKSTWWSRTGSGRYPVVQLKADITKPARSVIDRVAPRIAKREFPIEFQRDLKRRLNRINTRR